MMLRSDLDQTRRPGRSPALHRWPGHCELSLNSSSRQIHIHLVRSQSRIVRSVMKAVATNLFIEQLSKKSGINVECGKWKCEHFSFKNVDRYITLSRNSVQWFIIYRQYGGRVKGQCNYFTVLSERRPIPLTRWFSLSLSLSVFLSVSLSRSFSLSPSLSLSFSFFLSLPLFLV